MILWMVIRWAVAVSHQSSQEILSHVWSNTVMDFPICPSQHRKGKNECPGTLFHFEIEQSSAKCMGLLLRRIADWLGSRHTKSGRLRFRCCLGGTVQSSRYWRLEPGCHRAPSQLSTDEMLPTGMWTPFPSALWWQLKKLCSSLVLSSPGVVTFVLFFLW